MPVILNDSEVVQESPRQSLFKDCYFVSGRGIGIAKRFKDPALLGYTRYQSNLQASFL